MRITENVHLVPEVACNTYLILEPDGLTLVDAGLPRSHPKILRFIESLGESPRDLRRILITHSDWDHIGGLAALAKATGARTFASRIETQAMAAGRPSRPTPTPANTSLSRRLLKFLFRPGPFRVDEVLEPDQVIPILGGLRVLDSAGHSPGHISFFSPSISILFCGDSMVTDEAGIHGSRPIFTWDAAMAAEAVRRQAAIGARIVCSGHGPVITDAVGRYPV